MRNHLQYRGYLGTVEFSAEDHVFYGKVDQIRSLVSFEGADVEGLETAFRDAVDDYLETCSELGLEPEKPFEGTFNVRTGQERHRRAALYASNHSKSLNQVVNDALDAHLALQARENAQTQERRHADHDHQ